jgi:hypothetical protein
VKKKYPEDRDTPNLDKLFVRASSYAAKYDISKSRVCKLLRERGSIIGAFKDPATGEWRVPFDCPRIWVNEYGKNLEAPTGSKPPRARPGRPRGAYYHLHYPKKKQYERTLPKLKRGRDEDGKGYPYRVYEP